MYCSQCGNPNPDNAMSCSRCGAPLFQPNQFNPNFNPNFNQQGFQQPYRQPMPPPQGPRASQDLGYLLLALLAIFQVLLLWLSEFGHFGYKFRFGLDLLVVMGSFTIMALFTRSNAFRIPIIVIGGLMVIYKMWFLFLRF